ncbi:MAG: HEPN domain-containing protein [Candidatus Riflebacteria bacterium]|nr:HEPN domain-containing protein [Candidatus Riflebacteria bacterium]
MTGEDAAFWQRALDAVGSAERELPFNPNASASRAYYAAFYAVSAWFAAKGFFFTSHDGAEIALHRDLVKPGILPKTFAENFRTLRKARQVGDYGILDNISPDEATAFLHTAREVLEAIHRLNPGLFSRPGWMTTQS